MNDAMPGGVGQVSLQDALELQKRLVVKSNQIEPLGVDPRLFQTEFDGVPGKRKIVLFPREALLLRGAQDLAVPHQAGGAIVVKGGDAQNIHGPIAFSG